jgi:hypothetical protein
VPARYARPEGSTGFIGSAERFEYVQPASKLPPVVPAPAAGATAPVTPANNGEADVSAQ